MVALFSFHALNFFFEFVFLFELAFVRRGYVCASAFSIACVRAGAIHVRVFVAGCNRKFNCVAALMCVSVSFCDDHRKTGMPSEMSGFWTSKLGFFLLFFLV